MDLPQRKPNRLPDFDYNTPGAYFITICVEGKRCVLASIVGGGAFDAPQTHLTPLGKIAEKHIVSGNRIPNVCVEKYVIMPNHIHLLLTVCEPDFSGPSRAPAPTNAAIPHFVATFKRFCHKEAGEKIFQRSYHDHVIRDQRDYDKIWQYIDNNPLRWKEDCFYEEE
ncbi:MAG: transposase [Oscillospiraceae bacterium]|nr:transposase [Oscillospiraceae bacterium]